MASLITDVRRLLQDPRGSVATVFALSIIPVVAAVGCAVDYSRAASDRTAMQSALDAATLNIAKEAPYLSQASLNLLAKTQFDANFTRAEVQNVQVVATYNSKVLTITGSGTVPAVFMGLFGIQQMPIGALAATGAEMTVGDCVIALDPSANKSMAVSGNGSINVPNCGIFSNSSASASIDQKGASWINAKSIKAAGGIHGSDYSPTPKTYQPPVIDPLAGVPEPIVPGGCTFTNYTFSTPEIIPANAVLCGAIGLNADVTLSSGTIYFKGATVTTTASVNVVGDGVMLYFDENSTFTSSSSGTFSLKAPQTGPYAGIAIFGSRVGTTMKTFRFTGTKDYFVNGSIYLPTQRFELYGSADMTVSSKSGYVIAQQFYYQGNSSFTFDAFGSAVPSGLGSTKVVLAR
jgi:hypothetical protein